MRARRNPALRCVICRCARPQSQRPRLSWGRASARAMLNAKRTCARVLPLCAAPRSWDRKLSLFMSRLNIVLLVALIGCALSVVHTAYQQRRLFIALERAQLYYQQRALSKTARIERLATHRLNMVPVTNVVTQYLGVSKRSNAVQAAEECSKTVAAFCGGMQ